MLIDPWRIEMFGRLRASRGEHTISRFSTRKVAALLATLALDPARSYPREVLIEQLWPDEDATVGRNNLRVALASLRKQLEPPDVASGAVLLTGSDSLQLNPASITVDVAEYRSSVHAAGDAASNSERIPLLVHAMALCRDEFLSGSYDDWALLERDRLSEDHLRVTRWLVRCLVEVRDLQRAVEYAARAVAGDPLHEETRRTLMRIYAALGQPAAALQQFRELEVLLAESLGVAPSEATRQLAKSLDGSSRGAVIGRPVPSYPPTPPPISEVVPHPSLNADRTPRTVGTNLPIQVTRFFGRGEEIARITEMLAQHRLVTLTGPGGTGKTRLASEVARRIQENKSSCDSRNVYFVALADLPDARQIPDALLEAMHLPRPPNTDLLNHAIAALVEDPCMLVIDNFEHLTEDGSGVVRILLERVPTLTCLVTSRRVLGLDGEREIFLRPLETPDEDATLERAALSPSVQLFVDRAQAVRPDFQVTARNVAAVAALCKRLEGIPLALELAARRARALTPEQMVSHLARRFDLLVNRRAYKDGRHRSLRATIEWSFHLLSPAQRRFFSRLSVFRGGWTLSAAEFVCDEPEALEYLEQLLSDSLITANDDGTEMRFGMLETLREFGAERLEEESEADDIHARHLSYYSAWAAQAEARVFGPQHSLGRRQMEEDQHNLYSALEFGLDFDPCDTINSRIPDVLVLAAALSGFWVVLVRLREGREYLTRALDMSANAPPLIRARLLAAFGFICCYRDDYATALAPLEDALATFRSMGETGPLRLALWGLGYAIHGHADYARAREILEECLSISSAKDETWWSACCHNILGFGACFTHDYERARYHFMRSEAEFSAIGSAWGVLHSILGLARVAFYEGDLAASRAHYVQIAQTARSLRDQRGMAYIIEGFARNAAHQGEYLHAARLMGAAAGMRESNGVALDIEDRADHERSSALVRAAVGEEAFAAAWKYGTALKPDQAVELALKETPV